MYLSIIILPLLGSIVSGFFGRKVGVTGSRILSCLSIIITTILAIISFLEIGFNNNPISINLFKWVDSESFNMVWNFQFDSLTVSMLIPVLIISSLVHFYSIGYMSHDPHNQRFFSYLSLFTFMMVILVTGNNYLLMFVGWEGVGVCSYLLVSFWFTRIAANQSSMAAFLTNRVGDCFLTIGMFVILWSLGNLDYSTVFSLIPYVNENVITIIGICLLIGAMAKSSQVGLHIWLPMAMEGPTPVSALIHAATMVTAGVYLLIRSSPLIEYSSTVLLICLWLGAVTTVFSSLIGLFQQDIKKIIAYSTMSQLGMMVIAIGLSSYNIAIFHLINHAFYKGLLFLGAGAVIHAVVDNQDLRRYGGLISFLPLTYTVILIASLSLVAFPFMTGFFSKDFILESAYGQYYFSSIDVYIIAVIGAIFTTLYSVKVIYLTFLANPNGSINYYKNAHESDIFISLPLVILAIFSIYFGFITKDIFIGLGSGFFTDNSIFIHPMHEILIDTEFAVPTIFKLIPFILTISFSALAIIYPEFMPASVSNFKLTNLGYYIFGFFNQRFLIEYFYNKFIVNTVFDIGGQTTKILDKGSIEWIGPFGLGLFLNKVSKIISKLSDGVVTNYALYILIGSAYSVTLLTVVSVYSDIVNIITIISIMILININHYIKLNEENNNYNSLIASTMWGLKDIILILIKIVKYPFIIIKSLLFNVEFILFISILIGLTLSSDYILLDGTDDELSDAGNKVVVIEEGEKSPKIDLKGKGKAIDPESDNDTPMDTSSVYDPKGKGKAVDTSSVYDLKGKAIDTSLNANNPNFGLYTSDKINNTSPSERSWASSKFAPPINDNGEGSSAAAARQSNTNYNPQAGDYVTRKMLEIYKIRAENEAQWIANEESEYKRTNVLPKENYHGIMADMRRTEAEEVEELTRKLQNKKIGLSSKDEEISENKRAKSDSEDNSEKNVKLKRNRHES